jgi:uncharacterized protein (DUF1330 family)
MQAFLATDQSSQVMFLNCHRYYSKARYPAGFSDERYPVNVSGQEAYHRYLKEVSSRFVVQVGGRLLLAGASEMTFIGEGDWDEIVIGQYPSKAHAMRVTSLPGYDEIAIHRVAGLESALTMVLDPQKFFINNVN